MRAQLHAWTGRDGPGVLSGPLGQDSELPSLVGFGDHVAIPPLGWKTPSRKAAWGTLPSLHSSIISVPPAGETHAQETGPS